MPVRGRAGLAAVLATVLVLTAAATGATAGTGLGGAAPAAQPPAQPLPAPGGSHLARREDLPLLLLPFHAAAVAKVARSKTDHFCGSRDNGLLCRDATKCCARWVRPQRTWPVQLHLGEGSLASRHVPFAANRSLGPSRPSIRPAPRCRACAAAATSTAVINAAQGPASPSHRQ